MDSVESKLNNIKEAIRELEYEFNLYKNSNNHNKIVHMKNFITRGRSVTFIIQNLKSVVEVETFNNWYIPWQNKMKQNEILKVLVTMRNEIEKQGKIETSVGVYIEKLDSNDIDLSNPPSNAVSYFIGDQIGGSGWEIELEDGCKEKIYVDLPGGINVDINLNISELESTAQKLGINGTTQDILEYYLEFLKEISSDAIDTFQNF